MPGWVKLDRDVWRSVERHASLARLYLRLLTDADIDGPFAGSYSKSTNQLSRDTKIEKRNLKRVLERLCARGLIRYWRCNGLRPGTHRHVTPEGTSRDTPKQALATPYFIDGSGRPVLVVTPRNTHTTTHPDHTPTDPPSGEEDRMENGRTTSGSEDPSLSLGPRSSRSPATKKKVSSSAPKKDHGGEIQRILGRMETQVSLNARGLSEELVGILNGQRANGVAKDSVVLRTILAPLDRELNREVLDPQAWIYGLEAAIKREVPNANYVIKAARSWQPDRQRRDNHENHPDDHCTDPFDKVADCTPTG